MNQKLFEKFFPSGFTSFAISAKLHKQIEEIS